MNYFKYLSLLLTLSFFPKTKTSQPPHTERTIVKKPKAILQILSKALSCFMLLRSSLTQKKSTQPKKIIVKSTEKTALQDQWDHCQDEPTDTNDFPTPIIQKSISLNQEKPYIKMIPSIEIRKEVQAILKNEDLPECLCAIIIEMVGGSLFSKIILSSSFFYDFSKSDFDMRDLTEKFKEMLKQKKIIALSDLKNITTKDAKKIASNFMFGFSLEEYDKFDRYRGSDSDWSADKAMSHFFLSIGSMRDDQVTKILFFIPDMVERTYACLYPKCYLLSPSSLTKKRISNIHRKDKLLQFSLTQKNLIQLKNKRIVKSMEKAFPKDQWHHCQDDDPTDTNDSPTPIIQKSISPNQEKPYIKMTPSIEEVKTILKNEDLPECLYAIIIEMVGKNSFSKIILSSSLFNNFDKFYFDKEGLIENFKDKLEEKEIIALSDLKKITTKDAKKIAGNFMFSFCLEDDEFLKYTGADSDWSADKAMTHFFLSLDSMCDNQVIKILFFIPDMVERTYAYLHPMCFMLLQALLTQNKQIQPKKKNC